MRPGPSRRERWKGRVLRAPSISHGTRLFLVYTLARHMKADGFVSHPRWKLASEARVSERQVARYIANAVAGGWLTMVGGGYKTMTAEYQATFPDPPKHDEYVTLSEPSKGDVNKHPKGVTIASPFKRAKGDAMRHTTSSSTTRRELVTFAQSAHLASSLRLSSPTQQAHKRNEWLGLRHLGSFQPGRCFTPSGATRLAVAGFCRGDSRMCSEGAELKSKSATKGRV